MPVPTSRVPSKLPRPSTAYNNIPKPSSNHPPKIVNTNKEEQSTTRQNLKPRPSTALVLTSPKTCKTSLDLVPVKSRYLTAEDSRKRSATKAPPKDERPPPPRPAASASQGCDVMFLKKLLAMNKKQEIVINKKLVEMMKEPESDLSRANSSLAETRSNWGCERWQPTLRRQRGLEYDLNGRRVYRFDEESDEGMGDAETWIANTATVIETTSDGGDLAREVSSKRQSLTVIKQPARPRARTEERDEAEKLVVHCVRPDDDTKASAKKKLLKVWNYKSLLNSGNGGEGDMELKSSKTSFSQSEL